MSQSPMWTLSHLCEPPPAPPEGICNVELQLLAKWLELSLANIDVKLERLLKASTRNMAGGGRQKGWLAVQASGGASPRSWEQNVDVGTDESAEHAERSARCFLSCTENKNIESGAVEHTTLASDSQKAEVLDNIDSMGKQGSMASSVCLQDTLEDAMPMPWVSHRDSKRSTGDSVILSQRLTNFLSTRRSKGLSKRIWTAFQDPDLSTAGYIYELLVRTVIVVSVSTTLLQTLPNPPMNQTTSAIVETTFELFFLAEVFVRFIVSPNYRVFWLSVYNWIDLVSGAFVILRASLGFTIAEPSSCYLRCSILVGFCPVIRILKLLRRMHQVHLLYQAFIISYQALQPLLSMYFFMLLVFTGIVWVVEPRSNLADFPKAAWFTFVSMTTIGYGDVTPESAGGAVMVAVCVVSAMLYMAIPLGIIGSAFNDVWQDRNKLLLMEKTRDRLKSAGYKPSELPELFDLFDADRNGQLDQAEFSWLMHGLHLGLTRSRRQELFKAFDSDRTGGITHKEFIRGLFPETIEHIYGRQGSTISKASDDSYVIAKQIKKKIHDSRRESEQSELDRRQEQSRSDQRASMESLELANQRRSDQRVSMESMELANQGRSDQRVSMESMELVNQSSRRETKIAE